MRPFLLAVISLTILTTVIVLTPQIWALEQNISISAKVPPTDDDMYLTISSNTSIILHENDEATFTITYRSLADVSWPVSLTASYDDGIIQGSSIPIEVWDYVPGSASNTDGGQIPVVNLVTKTITWTIPSLPPSGINHLVTFKLKVKDTLSTENKIDAVVRADGTIGSSNLSQKTTNLVIQKEAFPTSTPTPTSAPSITPTPGQSKIESGEVSVTMTSVPTQTPTPAPIAFIFTSISFPEVLHDSSVIRFSTSEESIYTVFYGEKINALNSNVKNVQYKKDHEVTLTNLKEKTVYYIQVVTTNKSGRSFRSDVFTFTTSSLKDRVVVNQNDVTLSWNDILLFKSSIENKQNSVLVPANTIITINLSVDNASKVKSIRAKYQNSRILGIVYAQPPVIISHETELIEILPGVFSGQIATPDIPGEYEVLLTIHDVSNGTYTRILPQRIRVGGHFTIKDKKSGQPIERAAVKILRVNRNKTGNQSLQQTFELPLYTDEKGQIGMVLPFGTYIFEVSAPGYESQKINYKLGPDNNTYPTINLNQGLRTQDLYHYYASSLTDLYLLNVNYFNTIIPSNRFGDSGILLFQLFLMVTAIWILARNHKLGVIEYLYFVAEHALYKLDRFFGFTKDKIFIHVRKNNNKPLSGVLIQIRDKQNKLLAAYRSNFIGEIKLRKEYIKTMSFPVRLSLYRDNYHTEPIIMKDFSSFSENLTISMTHEKTDNERILIFIQRIFDQFFLSVFYIISILGIIINFLVIFYRGPIQAWPFILISLLMIMLWFSYLRSIWYTIKDTS